MAVLKARGTKRDSVFMSVQLSTFVVQSRFINSVSLVKFPYHRRLKALLLCSCDLSMLINSLVC